MTGCTRSKVSKRPVEGRQCARCLPVAETGVYPHGTREPVRGTSGRRLCDPPFVMFMAVALSSSKHRRATTDHLLTYARYIARPDLDLRCRRGSNLAQIVGDGAESARRRGFSSSDPLSGSKDRSDQVFCARTKQSNLDESLAFGRANVFSTRDEREFAFSGSPP